MPNGTRNVNRVGYDPNNPNKRFPPRSLAGGGRARGRLGGYDPNAIDRYLQEFLNYEYPEELFEEQKNVIGQIGAATQTRANRAVGQRQAAMTGGRLGSVSRAYSDIGGQVATGQQQAFVQLAREKQNVETRMKLAGLNAYIQKYGIDQNVMVALKNIEAQETAGLWGGIGEFLGGALQFGGMGFLTNWGRGT
jgi:hypothetical protein